MPEVLTPRSLFEYHRESLALHWLAGDVHGESRIASEQTASGEVSLVGYLNLIRPNRIQVLGASELAFLDGLGKNSRHDALDTLFGAATVMIVLTDGVRQDADLRRRAEASGIALLASALPSATVIDHLQFHVSHALAEKRILHGVLLDVMGIGVLLTGPSAIGKSELALELVTRGHRLVADDAPEVLRTAPNVLHGTCPAPLRGFLEVRGLGLVNIRAMFGDTAIRDLKRLHLIIRLEQFSAADFTEHDRLSGKRQDCEILEVKIPELLLPVAPGRNLAVIVEAAVRNHVLQLNGYDAAADFEQRQRRFMETGAP